MLISPQQVHSGHYLSVGADQFLVTSTRTLRTGVEVHITPVKFTPVSNWLDEANAPSTVFFPFDADVQIVQYFI